jgi:hypothetical protein
MGNCFSVDLMDLFSRDYEPESLAKGEEEPSVNIYKY